MIFFVNPGSEAQVEEVKESLARVTDVSKLRFVEATPEQARRHFDGLKTPYAAANDGYSPFVFVVDKELNLRSRNDDLKKENDYGYDLTQAVEMDISKKISRWYWQPIDWLCERIKMPPQKLNSVDPKRSKSL